MKKQEDLFATSCRYWDLRHANRCATYFTVISIIESIVHLQLDRRSCFIGARYIPRVTIRSEVVSRSGGNPGNHGRRDAWCFQASPLAGATLRLRGNTSWIRFNPPCCSLLEPLSTRRPTFDQAVGVSQLCLLGRISLSSIYQSSSECWIVESSDRRHWSDLKSQSRF